MTTATETIECLCGACGPCRREIRAEERAMKAAEVRKPRLSLSNEARAILDGSLKPKDKSTRSGRPALSEGAQAILDKAMAAPIKKARKKQPSRAVPTGERPTMFCEQCGEERLYIKLGKGHRVAGSDGLCEICADTHRMVERLAMHDSGEKKLTANAHGRARRMLGRVMKDGRPFHPDAMHGKASAYATHGCRCEPCRTAKAEYLEQYRKR